MAARVSEDKLEDVLNAVVANSLVVDRNMLLLFRCFADCLLQVDRIKVQTTLVGHQQQKDHDRATYTALPNDDWDTLSLNTTQLFVFFGLCPLLTSVLDVFVRWQ